MNDSYFISDNVCTKIDTLLDLIKVRAGNIRCDGFTGEEINFMIYDICVFLSVCMYLFLYMYHI